MRISRLIAQSWRSWKSARAIAGLAILALAVGIGCATAVFTVVDSVLLNPLPYTHSERWVALFGGSTLEPGQDRYSALPVGDLIDYQQRTHSFDLFGWYKIAGDYNLSSPGLTEHIQGIEVTPSLLDGVGVRPLIGRLFQDSDGRNVAVISNRLWRRLGSDAGIQGKAIALDGRAYTVVGVLPAWFQLPIVNVDNENPNNDVWIPVQNPPAGATNRSYAMYAAYARLKPGITVDEARADVTRVAAEITKETGRDTTSTAKLFGLQQFVVKDIKPSLFLFLGAAGLLLLITCANVGGLLVARSVRRAQETAVRVALGARKGQLMAQFLVEGLFLAVAAAGLGALASIGLTRLILSLAAEYIPRSDQISINVAVLLFAVALAFLTALLPALAPLRQALRTQPNEVLTSDVRVSAGLRSRRSSRQLVIAEIALAFLLLSAGGVLFAEFDALRNLWPGFDTQHLLTFRMELPSTQFPSSKELVAYQRRLLNSLEALPGVTSATTTNQVPLDGCCLTTTIYPEGEPVSPGSSHDASFVVVSPSYFRTMKIPLQEGRLLNEQDTRTDIVPVVIDEKTANRFWRGRNPLGAVGRFLSPSGDRFQVVGIVGNVSTGLGEATGPEITPPIYLPDALSPVREMNVVVRSGLPVSSLLPAIRRSVESVGPNLPIYSVRSMGQIVDDSLSLQRFAFAVVSFFALSALLLTCLGIYSMTSFSLDERTVELGTRMALGASPRNLLRLILGESWRLAAYGIAAGVPVTIAATWLVMRFMHLHHTGAMPYASSALVVGGLVTAASLPPAWRATFLSPLVAIRQQSEPLLTTGRRSLQQVARTIEFVRKSPPAPSDLRVNFAEATRRADSFAQALELSVAELRAQVRSQSAVLLEKVAAPEPHFRCSAASPEGLGCESIPADGYLEGRLGFHGLLTFGEDEFDTVLRWAAQQQPRYVPEVESLKRLGARAAVPLYAKEEMTGLLLFGGPVGREQFSAAEKEFMRSCGRQLALMTENARLTERIVEQEKVRLDVALAAEVQRRFLPQTSIKNETSSAAAYFLPARVVGGDCYDFIDFEEHGIGIALADVAGKGV
ncbi:MAG TPA: ADOP family duplicated permease, partial [Acidobacteriaceae bacterium]|nr:ADOP family duplicated permease [Acidobacteriaceae bacterium]